MNSNETSEGLTTVIGRFFSGPNGETSSVPAAETSQQLLDPYMTYHKGDLFTSGERVIAHGCNCVGVMGKGVAKIVATKFPLVKKKYKTAVNAGVFNLGYAQFVLDEENDICVYNLATQKQPGANASKWGVFLAFANMFEHAAANNITRIAIPKIGTGIGGMQWDDVLDAIDMARLGGRYPITIAVYEL